MLIFITIIAVCGSIFVCYIIHKLIMLSDKINRLSDKVDRLDDNAITYFSATAHQYDTAVHELNILKKALRQQGIATNYIKEEKLDYGICKEDKEE